MRSILKTVKHRKLVMLSLPLSIVLLAIMIATTKTSLVPQEDMGTIDVNVQCRPGYSLAQTGKVMDQVEAVVKNIPQIKIHTRIDGRDAQQNQTSSAGFLSVRLKNWSERTGRADDIDSVVNEIYRRTAFIKEADVNCATLPTIRGYGSASGFELYVQNRSGEDFKALSVATQKFMDALQASGNRQGTQHVQYGLSAVFGRSGCRTVYDERCVAQGGTRHHVSLYRR